MRPGTPWRRDEQPMPHPATGLYNPAYEHDSCGVAMVVDMHGRRSRDIVDKAITALLNLEHRGAAGAEPNSGDGAGIMLQIPDKFFRAVLAESGSFELPAEGSYASGIAFLPQGSKDAATACEAVEKIVEAEGLTVLGWREVPHDDSSLGALARDAMPTFRQLFIAGASGIDLERRVYVVRKRIEHELGNQGSGRGSLGEETVYFPSLSGRTFVYKGMLTTPQLRAFYLDLQDERVESALGIVHSRFSTNTFPSWPLAHPYRRVAHNGEINTVAGNENWMRAREALIKTDVFGDPAQLEKIFPICTRGASDTARFDEALELLHLGGRPLHHAVLMMIPEAWERHENMSAELRSFYEFHASLMEPWDGPASVCFTDGTIVGAVLDRNGLRPSRVWVTNDGLVVMASEAGVLDLDPSTVVQRTRLQPGRMFLVDTTQGRIVSDEEVKAELAAAEPYQQWLEEGLVRLEQLPDRPHQHMPHNRIVLRQQVFGYTYEEINLLVAPMARTGAEALGSMGTDTPIAVLSNRSRMLFDYFQQLFAQVTNPPLDAIREEVVTSLGGVIGPEGDLLHPTAESCHQILLPQPVLHNDELDKLIHLDPADTVNGRAHGFSSRVIRCLYPVAEGGAGLRTALESVRAEVSAAIAGGAQVIILSDRESDDLMAPIPSLLAVAAVHHHLVRERSRTKVGLVVEAGDAREVHHVAALVGFGAAAVNPYMAFESIEDLIDRGVITGVDRDKAIRNYIKAAGKGVLKVMSKMGISTLASYTGAQLFQAIGLSQELLDEYFTGLACPTGGIGLDEIAADVASRHNLAFLDRPEEWAHRELEVGGEYQWRREGEYHLFNPDTVFKLQHSTRTGQYSVFKEYTQLVDDQSERMASLRGLLKFKTGVRPPVPLDEVEPASEIVKRFSTGAMSFGSISAEAHETLAIAMNRLGGRSNSGEGGEDPRRFTPDENGDWRRSAIKQVASGRFGVTSHYLSNCTDIQIKMAQGAKPGEGGQLPAHKVYPWVAEVRHSTPGVGLISPPPHHDIYSIEDLAQLIHDLKNSNPQARIHVKLVSENGVGTVATGVSKAHADVVLISGHDGGTGATPLTSMKHAGAPWELGLAETQQTLLLNGLRDRIVVQVDGQLKTGRDVMIAMLLGGEEFGFATAPLVVSGCIMMRVCHLDTCPVGVATQNPVLRQRFNGKPEFVENFFLFIAEEVRELMAELGFRTVNEAVGQVGALDIERAVAHWKASKIDLTPVLTEPESAFMNQDLYCSGSQDHGLEKALDQQLIVMSREALDHGTPVKFETLITNVNRTVGTMLGHEVTKAYGGEGLPDDTIDITFTGSAGNSFGAFVPRGITLRLFGDANDYVGKGLSGGHIVVRPSREAPEGFVAEKNIIGGNVILFGATSGEAFLNGVVGERFAVRNSGAAAVVEGVGDHGCEYMTGGTVVVLGPTGRNFAAGMSGGVAYVYDPDKRLMDNLNDEMVDLDALDPDDQQVLRSLIEKHVAATDSAVGQRILADWSGHSDSFVKVMPRDYRRVLEAIADAELTGGDVNEAIMAAARG
ncbi:Putative ferredoxin-dependent glutamate synthase [Mycobacteroides abscessus subsp. bolletii]|uniref:Ferredoxin-dependent glutamate synthase n=2 Tax=Mycobacteroides abscessus TaxID=36809 RepID=A0A9Q7WKE7_9MYCO|nr:Putative ferredoxin-dependent glutamate synthase [Mycobacteroides abscessus]SHU41586.1 Putative ferredoxin-dependent glutamate synthase [Mycobacteroides abscessus subsp. abscessus]SHU65141.1 Putative ferredoxin-dependent glutamate synthase [Mycobacteroides abscessus subsp. bolletii]SHU64983.1 Putative ferredoxin-dependent glutamate synthase [Mycobacteroides abscessus subsp. abscessus]SHV13759.1 Putative ferredoxin-dependent glutamate synthase [Mycobacteroides abscessus subsp. bolletii]